MSLIDRNRILTEEQKEVIRNLPEELRHTYVLGGGTALSAFYLFHKVSDDLDFFAIQGSGLAGSVIDALLQTGFKIRGRQRIHDRRVFFLEVRGKVIKVEFVPLYFPRLNRPEKVNNTLFVESFEDIVANKLIAMSDRFDFKDYVDIYFVCKTGKMTFADVVAVAKRKYDADYQYLIDFDVDARLQRHQMEEIASRMGMRQFDAADFVNFYREVKDFFIQQGLSLYRKRGLSC